MSTKARVRTWLKEVSLRRAASVARIIDIDAQARGVVTDVAVDRDHEVQALAAGGLRPTVQALGLQQFAQPERDLDDEGVTSGTLFL